MGGNHALGIFTILTSLFVSCAESDEDIQQRVFDDYILIHFNSWSDASGRNYVPEFYFKPGDTLRLEADLNMLKIPSDTATIIPLSLENVITLDSGTIIKFKRIGPSSSVEITANIIDSVFTGIVSADQIIENQWGPDMPNQNRKQLLNELIRLKEEGIAELSKKYGVSKDSIYSLIANEYRQRTGRLGINY